MNLKTSTQATEITEDTEMKSVSPNIYFKALFFSVYSVFSVANCFSGMIGATK